MFFFSGTSTVGWFNHHFLGLSLLKHDNHYGVNLIIVGNQITIIMIFDYHMINNNHILTIIFLVTVWLLLVQSPFLLVKIPWLQAEKGETLFFILQAPNVGFVKTQVLPLNSLCLLLWIQCLVGQTLPPGYLTVDNSPSDDFWWLWSIVIFHSYVKIPVARSFLVKVQVNRCFKSQELWFLTKMYDPSIDISHLLNFPNYPSSLTSYHHFP